jgi:hypothetical protein
LITVPLGIGHAGAIEMRSFAIGLVIAVGGLILPFALELEGLRRLDPRIVAVIYSVDPAIAAVIGFLALGGIRLRVRTVFARSCTSRVPGRPKACKSQETDARTRTGDPFITSVGYPGNVQLPYGTKTA